MNTVSNYRYWIAATSRKAYGLPDTGNIETFIASTDARDNVVPQGTDFGYFGGGLPGPVSTVDRIDYSNDTATAVAKGPLASARYRLGATGNASFGYFGGGKVPSQVSLVERVDYSNDTATAVAKGPLSVTRQFTLCNR